MKQLVSNKFLDVPALRVYKSCVLVRSQYVCVTEISKEVKQTGRLDRFRKIRENRQHIRKVFSYLVASGLRDTVFKVRGRLMDKLIKGDVGYVSLSGIIEEVGSDVEGFSSGDKIAAINLDGPIYSDYYVIPALLCRKLPEEAKCENASGLLHTTIAGYIANQLKKENISDLAVIGDNLLALILEKLSNVLGIHVNRYPRWDDFTDEDQSKEKRSVLVCDNESLNRSLKHSSNYQLWSVVDKTTELTDKLAEISDVRILKIPDPESSNLDPHSDIPLELPEWLSPEAIDEGMSILTCEAIDLSKLVDSQISVSDDHGDNIDITSSIQIVNPGMSDRTHTVVLNTHRKEKGSDELGISFIGTGRFPREVYLPVISKQKKSHLRYIVDRNPFTARHVADHFHADYCSTDVEPIWRDERTDLVFIATYHDSHAALSAEALKAGKAVFVEKPLALDFDQLKQVVDVYKKVGGFITVGYNRRYAPATRLALECLNEEEGPTTVLCSIRAYEIPPTNYYYWPKEGTRIAGNACHWIDLAYLLVGQMKPVSVASMSSAEGRKDENYSITINFEDGSIAIIVFSTRGENLLGGHEWIDIKRGETSIFIDDFRRMKARRDGRTIKQWRGFRQKGHRQETIEVIDAVRNGKSIPIPFEDLVVGTSIIFYVRESLFSGKQITITKNSFPL